MPSALTHLAVAKRFLEKHSHLIKNVQDFLDGNVLPDLNPDKAISHCGVRTETNDILKYNREKVNPWKFVETHNMNNDLNKGQYLHLYVDYEFYNVFLKNYMQGQKCGKQVGIDIYETTRRDDEYLRKKYGVEYTDASSGKEIIRLNSIWDSEYEIKRRQTGYKFIFPYSFDELDVFIEKMSDVEIPN